MKTRQNYLLFILVLSILAIAGCGKPGHWLSPNEMNTNAPTVTAVKPINNATGVAINTRVAVSFSELMDPTTINGATFILMQGGNPVAGTVICVGSNAVFTPTSHLAISTVYTATITTGVRDLTRNHLAADYTWSFTTGLLEDVTPPMVTITIPADAATDVALNSAVNATFSEAMDPTTINTTSFTLQESGSPLGPILSGTVAYDLMTHIATFTPADNLSANTTYVGTITTVTEDLAGNALAADYVWSFTTGNTVDVTPPTVTLTVPADADLDVALNSAINATFSEAMAPLSISTATFTLQEDGSPLGPIILGSIAYDLLTHVATLTPSVTLAASTTYVATLTTGVKDLAGNALVAGLIPNPWRFTTGTGLAPGAIDLGSASTFGLMATAAITSTGPSVINGDVSLSPGTSMTGFPPGVVNGSVHINDAVAAQARADLLTAYNNAKALPPGTTIGAGADLGALYPGPAGIPPGTYTSGSTMLVSTPLILNAGGNANAVWVFQIGSSLTTGANVSLSGGAQAKNVFWVPTADATVGVGSTFYGTIISGRDVTAVTGATVNGRILAGAITDGTIALQTSTVNVPAP